MSFHDKGDEFPGIRSYNARRLSGGQCIRFLVRKASAGQRRFADVSADRFIAGGDEPYPDRVSVALLSDFRRQQYGAVLRDGENEVEHCRRRIHIRIARRYDIRMAAGGDSVRKAAALRFRKRGICFGKGNPQRAILTVRRGVFFADDGFARPLKRRITFG